MFQPKGRAIQIEDSIIERQPSFDSRHPRSLDSDVVIQVCCHLNCLMDFLHLLYIMLLLISVT